MRTRYLPLLGVALAAAGCGDLTIPDYRNPPLDDLISNPTVATVKAAATGVLQGTRQDSDTYVRWGGILGREGYFLDANETRYVRLIFGGAPSGANFTGNSYWTTPYRNIRTANLLISAVDRVELSAAEKSAIKGFARTIQALDYTQIHNTRNVIPVRVNTSLDSLTTPPPLAASRDEAWEFISDLLDEGLADLQAAGGIALPFPTPSGLNQFGFNNTTRFAQFNRALKARVEVIRASEFGQHDMAHYQAALTALEGSFINLDPATSPTNRTPLHVGPYQTYSPNSGDVPNTLSDPSGKTVADSALRSQAQTQQGSSLKDARLLAKTETRSTGIPLVSGLSSDLVFTLYTTRPFFGPGGQASPIPMIRNEELILLRAEARWFTGNKTGAMEDLNWIRERSGGLAPITTMPATDAEFVQLLLYEIRYSLLFEGAHSWVAYRRLGPVDDPATTSVNESFLDELHELGTCRLSGSTCIASDRVARWLPLPSNETLPRS